MSTEAPQKQLILPLQIVGSVDFARTIRELEALDDLLHQAAIRTPGTTMKMPRSSRTLEEFAAANGISLLDAKQREWLLASAQLAKDQAPQIHISFAVDPSAAFTRNIVIWLRQNIHPYLLLEVGLQPAIAAGCVVRTTNHIFDMSLRHYFQDNRELLVHQLGEAT
jgi:hypothetical protein